MPQINRIRVNNVKYNFGTQVYDDFMMRFNCSNTIYDLANGGGKSLLMLLLLQNVIPNCTLDDKQPIEKLFRQGGGNTVIHSLVEWKLDACYQKDNYKYMTTGFCARKAKGGDDGDTVTSDGAVSTGSADGGQEGSVSASLKENSSIEYFNYCIFYREFGDNDIKNLPLVSNGERITYNGLKAYLRELEKKDFNVSVKIFDRKGDYQSFISKYGIFESQWEIVRGINKTEGHVRTYFETNYKTSRKVVEDLLIEEIIQKSFNNRLGVDNDEGKMAQTLMDIKDKLLELSKKHARISGYDSQMAAIENFAEYVGTFLDVYDKKESLEKQLFDLLLSCKQEVLAKEKNQANLEGLLERMRQEMVAEQKGIQTAEVISEQQSLKSMEELVASTEQVVKSKEAEITAMWEKLHLMESANDYNDYLGYYKAYNEVSETVNNRMRDHKEILAELKAIATIVYDRNKSELQLLNDRVSVTESEYRKSRITLDDAKLSYNKTQEQLAVKNSLVAYTEQEIADKEKELANLMEKSGLLVVENAENEMERLQEKISLNKVLLAEENNRLESVSEKLISCKAELSGIEVHNDILRQELVNAKDMLSRQNTDMERLESLQKIYDTVGNADLAEVILNLYKKMELEWCEARQAAEKLDRFIVNAKNGKYTFDDPLRDKLKEYLQARYGEDVMEGHEWFAKLNPGQKRDVAKRAPFAEFGFVIKEDFERVKEDIGLQNFDRGAFTIPVYSEQILYDTKLEVNKELVVFAHKDTSFLREEGKREAEISLLTEELETLKLSIVRLEDRKQVVWEDYLFVNAQQVLIEGNSIVDEEAINRKIEANSKRWAELDESIVRLQGEVKELTAKVEDRKSELAADSHREEILMMTMEKNKKLVERYDALKEAKDAVLAATDEVAAAKEAVTEAERAYDTTGALLENATTALAEITTDWEMNYGIYYDSLQADTEDDVKAVNSFAQKLMNLDKDRLESRFFGLKGVIDKENVDVADKEALMNHYKVSMDKCKMAVEYRGSDWDAVKSMYEDGLVSASEPVKLRAVKDDISQAEAQVKASRDELDAQSALMNRLEGSIAHGINQIEEKYGAYEPFECDNPENFMKQHKELVKKLASNIKDNEAKLQKAAKVLKDMYVVEKDLERIVTNAGMTIPVVTEDVPILTSSVDVLDYESVSKEYDKHMKLAYRKSDEFNKHKQMLMDMLTGFDAVELAQEIRVSVKVPEDKNQTTLLVERLTETNTFIQLEKDRVAKGIEDMERIKNNFENRCVQTCCNIKTELDRLPKLSNITLDDEVISIIGLNIPYIKEELYKERMSSYIDETITIAESFKSVEERLKYIRNRLTWKRLFSVIVTDMNGIRIELYKRERIKDQSRYLRYEEAVGSTGQSQGIYIQFLIAIINYISSINAASEEAALIGKTIFIDNPFGAAKDIYIWEPIFKLLKTNHVQLIVPARGATPAITGRFDVNYILGQKLVDKRQQTVVVDYYSKTNQAQMEYTRMDYEQATFDFG